MQDVIFYPYTSPILVWSTEYPLALRPVPNTPEVLNIHQTKSCLTGIEATAYQQPLQTVKKNWSSKVVRNACFVGVSSQTSSGESPFQKTISDLPSWEQKIIITSSRKNGTFWVDDTFQTSHPFCGICESSFPGGYPNLRRSSRRPYFSAGTHARCPRSGCWCMSFCSVGTKGRFFRPPKSNSGTLLGFWRMKSPSR